MSLVYGLAEAGDLLSKLRRARKRLVDAVSVENDTAIGDAIFDFVVTGYHIRDWIKNGTKLEKEVDAFVEDSSLLQACRDICNASKHFQVDRYKPLTADVYFSAPPLREATLGMKGGIKILMSDGQKFEVTEFASAVLELWEQFFESHDLGIGT